MTQEEYYQKWLQEQINAEEKEEKALDNGADLLAEYYRGLAHGLSLMLNDSVKLNIPDVSNNEGFSEMVVCAHEWISVKDNLPEELQTVWACNNETKFVALACLTYYDGWLWAVSNGNIYSEDGKIISECELDDDYDFTHWMPLPELPSA